MDHAAVMNNCSAKAERIGLARLTAAERVVYLASSANFEIELGGFSGFFYNSAGDHAAESARAMEAIGALHAAQALRSAMARFPGGIYPADRRQRYKSWRAISESLVSLDQEYGREDPDVFSRLCIYIEDHAAELQEHGAAT
jgi:hypothetical protein